MMNYNDRIDQIERIVNKAQQTPTVSIYDSSDVPQDAVRGQIAVGSDASFNWFDGTNWHTQAGTASVVGNTPQDAVDGQIVIGTDGSFHWCVSGTWYTSTFITSTVGNVPQDLVRGQIAIGTDGTFHWYGGTEWHTFA